LEKQYCQTIIRELESFQQNFGKGYRENQSTKFAQIGLHRVQAKVHRQDLIVKALTSTLFNRIAKNQLPLTTIECKGNLVTLIYANILFPSMRIEIVQ
jgi:hypothetical protein